jgi:two-component system cell cycle sensor histidine kinase/response regulator CckA
MQQSRRPEGSTAGSQEQLLQQRELRTLLDNVPAGIIIRQKQTVVYVNPAFAESLGYGHPSELIGRSVLELLPPEEREKAVARYGRAERDQSPTEPSELLFQQKDGQTVTLEGRSVPLSSFEGAPAFARVIRDISGEKRWEAQLVLADRMASVGTLAAGVAHEINNPLAYVAVNMGFAATELSELYAELARLERFVEDGSPAIAIVQRLHDRLRAIGEALSESREGADRIRLIVRDLKTFSRADEDGTGPADVHSVIESAANLAANEIRLRARLVRSYGDVPLVCGNEARLAQVVLNLLVNAAQAIPEGKPAAHHIRVATSTDTEGRVVIEVSDTGTGIAPEIRGRIFDPFFTTKPVGVGTGLGLSICHGIVTSMGGHIDVESESGAGATFKVVLPAARTSEPSAKMQLPSEPPNSTSSCAT